MRSLYLPMILFLSWLLACRDKGDTQPDALDTFLSARCRFLVEAACIESQNESCGNVVSYETQEDCEKAERDALGKCADEADEALADVAELDQCVSVLATFDCLSQAVCTDGIPVYNAGDCNVITSLIAETCP